MKILVLIESLKIDNHSAAIVGTNYINALVKTGNRVHVLYPDEVIKGMPNPEPKWLHGCTTERFKILKKGALESLFSSIPKGKALPLLFHGNNAERLRWVRSWKAAIENVLERDDYDLIVALGVGAVFAPHFAMSKVKTQIPWMAYIHDPFPFHHYPDPYRVKKKFSHELQYIYFDRVLRKATWVGFPSLRLKEWMQRYHPSIAEKSIVSPHVEFDKRSVVDEKNEILNLERSHFNLLHAGSLLGHRDPSYLIESFRAFIGNDPEKKEKAHLYILGSISDKFASITSRTDPNIHLYNMRLKYNESLTLLRQADVLVLIETIAEESPFMPGKLADYIASDRPILALTPSSSETARLLGREYPYVAEVNDTEAIEKKIERLWHEWKSDRLDGLKRPDLQKYISAEHLNEIVHRMVGGHS